MADVAERAQVLLMAALGMAILFVALALILNTAIYTENLATRGSEVAGGGDAVRYIDTARAGIGGAIGYVNRHNHSDYATLQRNISAAVPGWADASRKQFAHRGRNVDVSLDDTKNGTRIEQVDSSRNFTDNGANETWTLAADVHGTRNFTIDVGSVSETFGSGHGFGVRVSDSDGDWWRMNVTDDGTGDVQVSVRNGTGAEFNCTAVTAPVTIDVGERSVGGEDCEGLSFREGVDAPYTIQFENADNVTGTYSLTVDNDTLADNTGQHLNTGSPSPYAEHALYSANLSVTYQTPRLFYNTTIRVAPGEADG